MRGIEAPLDPPPALLWDCRECGEPIDGEGWCDPCAVWIRQEAARDE